jgi:translation initiation factor 3 subunit A
MDPGSLRRLQLIQLDKERGELHEKLRVTGKRIDHFERALRREEIPLLNNDYDVQLAQESRLYEKNKQQKLAVAAARHKESIGLKRRLERILPDYQAYRSIIEEKRSEEFEGRKSDARNALEAEKAKRRSAFRKFQEEENRKREERERQEELEREQTRREEEEAIAKEETARREAAEKARVREEEKRFFNFVNVKVLTILESEMKFWRNKDNGSVKRKKELLAVDNRHLALLRRLD